MSQHTATIAWQRRSQDDFLSGRYSREHSWTFDGGAVVAASPSPHVVRPPFSNPQAVDPEEAFVAAISSCHMLTFLYLASKQGFTIERYEDRAVGQMSTGTGGLQWISEVVLHPEIEWSGARRPSDDEVQKLHDAAHHQCFIANSVKCSITVGEAGAI